MIGKDDKKPVVGATVQIRSERKGAVTDKEGKFSFAVSPGDHKLEVSFIGYQTYSQSIKVGVDKTTELNI